MNPELSYGSTDSINKDLYHFGNVPELRYGHISDKTRGNLNQLRFDIGGTNIHPNDFKIGEPFISENPLSQSEMLQHLNEDVTNTSLGAIPKLSFSERLTNLSLLDDSGNLIESGFPDIVKQGLNEIFRTISKEVGGEQRDLTEQEFINIQRFYVFKLCIETYGGYDVEGNGLDGLSQMKDTTFEKAIGNVPGNVLSLFPRMGKVEQTKDFNTLSNINNVILDFSNLLMGIDSSIQDKKERLDVFKKLISGDFDAYLEMYIRYHNRPKDPDEFKQVVLEIVNGERNNSSVSAKNNTAKAYKLLIHSSYIEFIEAYNYPRRIKDKNGKFIEK